MIITSSPLRITLGGGGTDLKSYYEEHEGFAVSAAIDKYVYITLHKTFQPGLIIKYSEMERVDKPEDIRHPIVRETMRMLGVRDDHLELCSIADIPAGTGLGSSGSFTTALLKAFHEQQGNGVGRRQLAEEACEVEIDRLKTPCGKQDQYIASYGGLTCMTFHRDGYVEVEPLHIVPEIYYGLEDGLMLFFTGYSRASSSILTEQRDKSEARDADMLANLHFVKALGYESKRALEKGDLMAFGALMNAHWEHKKQRAENMSNPQIDTWYEYARQHGAVGGKLIGAGGGGFLMFYTEKKNELRAAMATFGLSEVRFRFERQGTRVVV